MHSVCIRDCFDTDLSLRPNSQRTTAIESYRHHLQCIQIVHAIHINNVLCHCTPSMQ